MHILRDQSHKAIALFILLYIQGVFFLTVPPDFQYQNEKQFAANQNYFFKKFLM